MLDTATDKKLNTGIPVPEYFIGVDAYEKDASSYCLIRRVNGIAEVLLSKVIRDESTFEEGLKIYLNILMQKKSDLNNKN